MTCRDSLSTTTFLLWLQRLSDECKEEEDKRSAMNDCNPRRGGVRRYFTRSLMLQ